MATMVEGDVACFRYCFATLRPSAALYRSRVTVQNWMHESEQQPFDVFGYGRAAAEHSEVCIFSLAFVEKNDGMRRTQ